MAPVGGEGVTTGWLARGPAGEIYVVGGARSTPLSATKAFIHKHSAP